jgi:hypothetical protein
MMRLFWCAILVVAGCDMGGPAFIGLEPMRISVGGSDFTIRQRNDWGGVIRTNVERALDPSAVADKILITIQ